MPDHVNRERYETKPATDSRSEADGLESCSHSFSIKVEYYRSLEYYLEWERPMNPRRSSRLPKAAKKSPQRSPSRNEEVIQRKLRSKRQRTGQRKTEAGDGVINTDEGSNRDIIDIINYTHDVKCVAEEDEGKLVEIADNGVDESDEDCASVTSSVASGPSVLYHTTSKKRRRPRDLCSACQKLYQRAKKMKAQIKNKLLDNDPKSLTCDQWVLIKKWRPRRLPNATGKRLIHVKLVQKRLALKKGVKRSEQQVIEGESSACSRPHTFLQRNLRRCIKVPVKKERKNKRRKRTSDDSQGSRVAKQQRLHSNSHHQRIDNSCTDSGRLQPTSGHGSSPGFESCSDQETNNQADTDQTVELIPCTVTLETNEHRELLARQQKAKKTSGFRDLLAQLRGNSSMIVRETR
ncbi:uncharacterized protein si:ch211-227n13.3 isoform X1 [Seriola aureovittata]|uniref:uncharacterized protein si:ch211-227n13.3 isoform X1 n=2 Tax=Seriola aureovittata TaxID=2871759 RepID=UPI0024BEB380|nr:uncharacterized protein si:ch211-227n13.3 isoform X1 [Seriola aureovittata]